MKRNFVFFMVGLTVCTLGFVLYLQGPKRYIRYESENLGHWTRCIAAENSKEIQRYFSGSGDLASNLTLVTSVTVLDGPRWVYVLKEAQFATWQENGTINRAFVSKNVTDRFDLDFEMKHTTS